MGNNENNSTDSEGILCDFEIDQLIAKLTIVEVEKVGSSDWISLHECVEKLHMQAAFEAQTSREERTRQAITDSGKVPLLVADLIVCEVWRRHVLPLLLAPTVNAVKSPLLYMILYHELSVLSLLALVVFQPVSATDDDGVGINISVGGGAGECDTAAASAGDVLLDLIDYCHRCIASVQAAAQADSSTDNSNSNGTNYSDIATTISYLHRARPSSTDTAIDELLWQRDQLQLQASQQAVSVLYYIGEQLPRLSISVSSRLLRTHDTPLLLASLIEHPPWLRSLDGIRQKLEQRRWLNCPDDGDSFSSSDGQCWLLLVRLLLSHSALYQLSEARCRRFLRLQPLLQQSLIEKVPALQIFKQWLCQLSVGQMPSAAHMKTPPVIETVSQLWQQLTAPPSGGWKLVAQKQLHDQFSCDPELMRRQADRLSQLYDLDKMADLLPDTQKCNECGGEAMKRCAGCRQVWYCGRRCQSKHWPQHRTQCQQLKDTK